MRDLGVFGVKWLLWSGKRSAGMPTHQEKMSENALERLRKRIYRGAHVVFVAILTTGCSGKVNVQGIVDFLGGFAIPLFLRAGFLSEQSGG